MSGIEHLTKCFNCNEPYDVAKLLPCGHSICSQCEQTYHVIDCGRFKEGHNCAQVHRLRSDENGGAQQLPTNHSIMQLIKLLNNPANEKSLRDAVENKHKEANAGAGGENANQGSGNKNYANLFANPGLLSSHEAHGLKGILKHQQQNNSSTQSNNNTQ